MFRTTLLAITATLSFSFVSTHAGIIFVGGDSNFGGPLNNTHTTQHEGNRTWFTNILGAGTTAKVQDESGHPSIELAAIAIDEFYNSLPGVTSSPFAGTITAADLSGVDLFVSILSQDGFAAGETTALADYLANGGNLFLMGENQTHFAPGNARINTLLADLGSSMRLGTASVTSGFQTTFNIDPDPLNAGVESVRYAYTTTVVGGGTSLLRTRDADGAQTFVAYEVIPEPAAGTLFVVGLAGILGRGRRTGASEPGGSK